MSDNRLEEMATFLVAMPGWTPEMYWRLTLEERNAIVEVLNKKYK